MRTFSKIILALTIICTCLACNKNSDSTVKSNVAQIVSFAFQADDDYPGLGEAQFVVEQSTSGSEVGLIRMRANDSIRFGTPLTAVIPKISYYTTPSAVSFYIGGTEYALTGYDTLDLSQHDTVQIHVIAQNEEYDKWYNLIYHVHTADGDLFKWEKIQDAIPGAQAGIDCVQKALLFNKQFFYFQNDGSATDVFISSDLGSSWTHRAATGLPADCDIRQIVEGDSLLFYGKGHMVYYSSDGIEWKSEPTDLDIAALYMCMQIGDSAHIWMAARDKTDRVMRFYSIGRDLRITPRIGIGLAGDSIPRTFPMEEYATIPFTSSSQHLHAVIAGGWDRNKQRTNAVWNLEYNSVSREYHLSNMTRWQSAMPPFEGTSICYYDNYMYLLGGLYGDNQQFITNVYTSLDEGVNWIEVTDATNSKRPEEIKGRFHTNTFVCDSNLYIIGGEDLSTTYSDVYRGRANSISWKPIGN